MVDIFLGPVKVGGAGREVGRGPPGGEEPEPRRITGKGQGGYESLLGASTGSWKQRGSGRRVPGSAERGEKEKKRRVLSGTPLPPHPRAEPTAARGLLELLLRSFAHFIISLFDFFAVEVHAFPEYFLY